jgi:predicted transcriptional regulator
MPRPSSPHPTEAELEILKVLWSAGPATVRTVRDALAASPESPKDLALTTVTTLLNIMVEKGYLERTKNGPRFEYRPLVTFQENSARMVQDLVARVFDGSAAALVLNVLDQSELDAEELKALRKLIEKKARAEARKPE